MRLAQESVPVAPVLLLSDSQAALSAVCNAAACRWARTADLRAVVDAVGDWANHSVPLRLTWVKAHIGVSGNQIADAMAKDGSRAVGDPKEKEGGVRGLWKRFRAAQRRVVGFGAGRATRWGQPVLSRYVQARTGKGDLRGWQLRLGRGDGLCRL